MPPRIASMLTAAALLVSLAGCEQASSHRVAAPPRQAEPEAVVAAYVAAINAHDTRTARRLMTATRAREVAKQEHSWLGDDVRLSALVVRPAVRDPDPRVGHEDVVDVPVRFVLHGSDDASMPDGRTSWGFLLRREGPRGRWRIWEEGVG